VVAGDKGLAKRSARLEGFEAAELKDGGGNSTMGWQLIKDLGNIQKNKRHLSPSIQQPFKRSRPNPCVEFCDDGNLSTVQFAILHFLDQKNKTKGETVSHSRTDSSDLDPRSSGSPYLYLFTWLQGIGESTITHRMCQTRTFRSSIVCRMARAVD